MPRRFSLLLLVVVLVVSAPAAADLGARKQAVDSNLASLQDRIARARAREAALTADIAAVTTRIRSLESQVGDVSTKLASLDDDLALHQRRIDGLAALYRLQSQQFAFLKRQYSFAVKRFDARLVGIYEQGEPSTIEVILASKSFQEIVDQIDYLKAVARQDETIASTVAVAKAEMRRARSRTLRMGSVVASETRVIAYRRSQQAILQQHLLATTQNLGGARQRSQRDLAATQETEKQWTDEARSLSGVSSQLAAQIQAAQAAAAAAQPATGADSGSSSSGSGSSTPSQATPPSSSGLIWPVAGTITSPFGMRWGSLHPGLDIAAPTGTPIHAAAAGRVLVASYSGGYGNLVVLDNGGGIATAYAHQSQLALSVGQQVAQGQVIGYVGSTGFSTGPHLHFEVRVNGTPVDPMGYL